MPEGRAARVLGIFDAATNRWAESFESSRGGTLLAVGSGAGTDAGAGAGAGGGAAAAAGEGGGGGASVAGVSTTGDGSASSARSAQQELPSAQEQAHLCSGYQCGRRYADGLMPLSPRDTAHF